MHLVLYELAVLGVRGWVWTGGFGWPWPGLIWFAFVLLFWGGLLALLIWAVRSSAAPRRAPESAMDVLRRRLAAGEITEEEYERIRQLLRN